ncbi:MAG: hypothetical protein ACREOZ_02810, partial [Gloeomargaritales cyanobacterium]
MHHMQLGHATMAEQTNIRSTIETLEQLLRICNPYVRDLLMAKEITEETLGLDKELIFHSFPIPEGEHSRKYNLPGAFELCCVVNDLEEGKFPPVVVRHRASDNVSGHEQLQRVHDCQA